MTLAGLVTWSQAEESKEKASLLALGLADAAPITGRQARVFFSPAGQRWESLHVDDFCAVRFHGYLLPSCHAGVSSGDPARTMSSAEVVARIYNEHGADGLERLNGAYSVALFDRRSDRLILLRDAIGRTNLHHAFSSGLLAWHLDSEPLLKLPFVSRAIDSLGFSEYWFLEWPIPPKTIWRDVAQVPNGHFATCDGKSVALTRYYCAKFVPKREPSEEEARAEVRAMVMNLTAEYSAVAGADACSLLSGGVDSNVVLASLVHAGARPPEVFTFKAERAEVDESEAAIESAAHFQVPVRVVRQTASDLFADLDTVVSLWGEPYSQGSVMAIVPLLKAARERSSSIFTDDGGGEAFLGMQPLDTLGKICLRRRYFLPLAAVWKGLCAVGAYGAFGVGSRYVRQGDYVMELVRARNEQERWLAYRPITLSETNMVMTSSWSNLVTKHSVSGVLDALLKDAPAATEFDSVFARLAWQTWNSNHVYPKTMRAARLSGIMSFSPLTDHRFQDLIYKLTPSVRGPGKRLLRDAFKQDLHPTIYGMKKMGLQPSNREMFVQCHQQIMDFLVNRPSPAFHAVFSPQVMRRMLLAHQKGVWRTSLIFSLLVFRSWFDRYNPDPSL